MLTIRVNGEHFAASGAKLADLLAAQGVVRRRGVAVAVNGEVVPAGRWQDHLLTEGDEVEIVKPIGGG